jgi:dipeptidase E
MIKNTMWREAATSIFNRWPRGDDMKEPQIIAMGGGGFSMEPDNPLLDEYFIKQTGERNPAVCFVPTASGDADGYIVKFYSAFNRLRCRPTHLSVFRPPQDLETSVLEQNAIYVGGGNTKNLLALWREWGLDRILHKAWQQGIVLGGISAGSICWFDQGLTDSVPGRLTVLPCLGFLKGSNCPHYDGEPKRRPAYQLFVRQGKMKNGIATDNGVALHFVGQKLAHVVSSRPDAAAYHVHRQGKQAKEERIVPQYLGKP